MTSRELVQAALAGQPVPRTPAGPLAVHACARFAGRSLREFSTDATTLAECVLRYHDRFRPDAVWVSADTWVSAEAMGARLAATDPSQPLGGTDQPTVRTVADLERIPPPRVESQGRYPILLAALDRVVRELGREVYVVACFDQFPFSLAAALMGLEDLMLRCYDDPPFVEALLARCADYAVAYGTALGRVGADLLSGGDSPAGLLDPGLYASLAQPAEARVIAALRASTGKPVSLHICGRIDHLVPMIARSGPDVLEFDAATPAAHLCRQIDPKLAVWGNLDPVRCLAQASPDQVRSQTRRLLDEVRSTGHSRFVASSGCTLAVDTPPANLDAFFAATRP